MLKAPSPMLDHRLCQYGSLLPHSRTQAAQRVEKVQLRTMLQRGARLIDDDKF